jgi:hypothetical protein
MVGNAVPPKFAKAIALALNDFLKKYYWYALYTKFRRNNFS